jgi:hypothetical protein
MNDEASRASWLPALRRAGAMLGKGAVYALAFWAVYGFVYLPIYNATHKTYADSEAHTDRQMNAWDEQSRRSGEMLEDAAMMQRRYEVLLEKQEQQVRRMDAILDAWERQANIKPKPAPDPR